MFSFCDTIFCIKMFKLSENYEIDRKLLKCDYIR